MLKKILIHAISIIVILGLGIFIGTKIKKTAAPIGTENTFQAGWDAAKARLAQSPYVGPIILGMEIKSVSGTIQKIDGNKLTVQITPLEPLADPALDIRVITVDANTQFSLNAQKDPAQLQKELQEFQDKMETQQKEVDTTQPKIPIASPGQFEQKSIKLSDLKENQQILVIANENIKDKKEFAAIEINAQEVE